MTLITENNSKKDSLLLLNLTIIFKIKVSSNKYKKPNKTSVKINC